MKRFWWRIRYVYWYHFLAFIFNKIAEIIEKLTKWLDKKISQRKKDIRH